MVNSLGLEIKGQHKVVSMLNGATTQCWDEVYVNVSVKHGVVIRLKCLVAPKLVCHYEFIFWSRWDIQA